MVTLSINETKVENLGIIMNSSLQWEDHIAKMSFEQYAKLFLESIMGEMNSRCLGELERAFNSMTVNYLRNLHVNYACKLQTVPTPTEYTCFTENDSM
uniref:Uncharacterized protein n=1 Tax=Megaselia scalaris TaxID=36166 RepID=T1H170_MEGSC